MRFITRNQAKLGIFDYIEAWYNPQRIHSKLGYLSPDNFEKNGVNSTCNVVKAIDKNMKVGTIGIQL